MDTEREGAERASGYLFSMGLVVVALGAIGMSMLPAYASWCIGGGGLLVVVSMMVRAMRMQRGSVRERRLDRMTLMAGLIYIVSSGLAMLPHGRQEWVVLFTIATVLVSYAIFVRK